MEKRVGQLDLFHGKEDDQMRQLVSGLSSSHIQIVGHELILGKLFDFVGFNEVAEPLFRHLVLGRLVFPGSKLKTVDYLFRFQGAEYSVSSVYRYLDSFQDEAKEQIEKIALSHVRKVLGEPFAGIFYDITTLYFETSKEDELRRIGYSKDGKVNHPQILVGLLVGAQGFPIAFVVFEGNKIEGLTLISFLENNAHKMGGIKPMVVADARLLNKENLEGLRSKGYEFIIGARQKNEPESLKQRIINTYINEKSIKEFKRTDGSRLLVKFSEKRKVKDLGNRTKGFNRLADRVKSGKLTKEHINQKGYHRYLIMDGDSTVKINQQAFDADAKWDGLKGYVTYSKLKRSEIVAHYKQLWHIEKAFRISKTDLAVRPIYHRKANRIRAHILIAFCAYLIWKEVERQLGNQSSQISASKAIELCQNIYQITFTLPKSQERISHMVQLSDKQQSLIDAFLLLLSVPCIGENRGPVCQAFADDSLKNSNKIAEI